MGWGMPYELIKSGKMKSEYRNEGENTNSKEMIAYPFSQSLSSRFLISTCTKLSPHSSKPFSNNSFSQIGFLRSDAYRSQRCQDANYTFERQHVLPSWRQDNELGNNEREMRMWPGSVLDVKREGHSVAIVVQELRKKTWGEKQQQGPPRTENMHPVARGRGIKVQEAPRKEK